ncbi:MAG: hypothetical protein NDJ89_13905 [Oligoflexia bacterium]|nr:hypothetical protein [Oligoflexia bacterium]
MKYPKFASFLAILFILPLASALGGATADPDADYDRLDGRGASGKKVDVIEWEGNLEIHVYPVGSLKGLALKLDKRNKDKPVMVIGYRFDSDTQKQLIRRAILGIDLREGFRAYKDPMTTDYDKIVISNNGLASPLALFKLDQDPKQLYPDGHPALAANDPKKPEARQPAGSAPQGAVQEAPELDENGTIRPFFSEQKRFLRDEMNMLRR